MTISINGLNPNLPAPTATHKTAASSSGFGEQLKQAMQSVNETQLVADQAVEKLHSGQSGSLHETMIALEKADISMRLFVQLRNKAVEAYQEIMRMQV